MCRSPRSPWINCRMVLALVSMMDSITSLPASFQHRDHNRIFVNIEPDILDTVHRRVFLSVGVWLTSEATSKGRPSIMRGNPALLAGFPSAGEKSALGLFHGASFPQRWRPRFALP